MLAGNSGSKSEKEEIFFIQIDQRMIINNYSLKSINVKTKACCTDSNILVIKKLLSLKSLISAVERGGARKIWLGR